MIQSFLLKIIEVIVVYLCFNQTIFLRSRSFRTKNKYLLFVLTNFCSSKIKLGPSCRKNNRLRHKTNFLSVVLVLQIFGLSKYWIPKLESIDNWTFVVVKTYHKLLISLGFSKMLTEHIFSPN